MTQMLEQAKFSGKLTIIKVISESIVQDRMKLLHVSQEVLLEKRRQNPTHQIHVEPLNKLTE